MMKYLPAFVTLLFLNTVAMADSEYRHIVLFSFKKDAAPDDVTKIEKAFAALPEKIDVIQDFEWGTDVSPEGKAKGFTHCFLVTFKDKAGLDVYIPHEAHQAFVSLLKPSLQDVLVIDYIAK
ncbi:Dabb family protein [Haloferula sp.]|uniref:Dabb family protein n=1 Tax=Haloferula sp. TaxID=2497595 RepID=UPI00329AA72F